MITSKYLKVNTPNIVHETIDGETILLDLQSGNYFSLDGAGAAIWDFIAETGDWKKVIELMTQNNSEQRTSISNSIEKYINNLVKEKLLIPVEDGSSFNSDNTNKLESILLQSANDFKEPVVHKYSDMQDLLLLDPIHDVDEKGWPEAQDTEEKNEEEAT